MSKVKLSTNHGDIVLHLDAERAPLTTENFVQNVKDGFYNGTLFSRIIPGFAIQGGGYEPGMFKKSHGAPILNEADNGLKNTMYTVAMARTQDPHSAAAEFFINLSDNDFLNHSGKTPQGWGYAVFGEVAEGQDVVIKMTQVATGTKGPFTDVPKEDVIIERAEVLA
ncbi:peptidylprolyl isomerase (plasmid) [Streptomyces globisporus]|uniref:peptidylprolyl isomerase n=1 Tax=Streptomyces globisporus TaxID=1908 RepID=UPI002F9077D0|nr:peptidylprolyl isomerase [Streptomyces globisporus]